MGKVEFKKSAVRIDGKPTQIISGAIHYFRIPRKLWKDRLEKAVQCGLNAVETYMCWNLHEPQKDKFKFSGMLDFEAFIKLAGSMGLYVIVRPGPFICAEWDNGGFPAWLMIEEGIEFRRMNKPYLNAVNRYYKAILPRLKKLQYTAGGPVIAVQVENEYGSYGTDKEYINYIRELCVKGGINVPLFTADGASDLCIVGGIVPKCPMALTFGSKGKSAIEISKKYRPDDPFFCMEFWNGWFDHWKTPHHTRPVSEVVQELDDMLSAGGSVNFYMFHGGTNFGFTNGANGTDNKDYGPTVTSYDYDCPVSECGDLTEKFFAVQEVIKKYRPDAKFGIPKSPKKIAYGEVRLTQSAELFANLDTISKKKHTKSPQPMEKLGQSFGFIHYRTKIAGPMSDAALHLMSVRDRAMVFINGKHVWTYYRNDAESIFKCDIPKEGITLDILVENMGRINYGPKSGLDLKGICGGVGYGNQYQFDWDTWTLPMDNLKKLKFGKFSDKQDVPAFHRGTFEVKEVADTFLKFPGVKGIAFINGFNLGRYWNEGPGSTMYIPAPLLKKGKNELVIFELHKLNSQNAELVGAPKLD